MPKFTHLQPNSPKTNLTWAKTKMKKKISLPDMYGHELPQSTQNQWYIPILDEKFLISIWFSPNWALLPRKTNFGIFGIFPLKIVVAWWVCSAWDFEVGFLREVLRPAGLARKTWLTFRSGSSHTKIRRRTVLDTKKTSQSFNRKCFTVKPRKSWVLS